MTADRKKVLLVSFVIFAVLLAMLFLNIENSKIVTAVLLTLLATATALVIKKRGSLSISRREVLLLSSVMAIIFVVIKEMSGLYFGFYMNPYYVTVDSLIKTIIPAAVIIVTSEIIRYVILAQKNKVASFITYLSCVLAEVLIYSNIAGIVNFYRFMDLVGLTLLPAIGANVLYHYISKNYGMLPNISYRLITTLYIYFVTAISGMSDALDACIRIVIPILIYTVIASLFSKKQRKAVQPGQKAGTASVIITLVCLASVAMLISCQFRFCALVIATESMTGEINKGDMIIYEKYDDQEIEVGQVIVFDDNEAMIVHRVVRIENINGETRYFTKGDANPDEDHGYRTQTDIVGLTDLKIAHAGYPTLWLHELLRAAK